MNDKLLTSSILPVINKKTLWLEENEPVSVAVRILSLGQDFISVCRDKKIIGQITLSDLNKLTVLPQPKTVLDLYSPTISITQDAEIWQLLKIINGENSKDKLVNFIPVVRDKESKEYVGIIYRSELRDWLNNQEGSNE